MKNIFYSILFFVLGTTVSSAAVRDARVSSPNGELTFVIHMENSSPFYQVMFKKQTLIASSPLSLDFENGSFGKNLKINKVIRKKLEEEYDLIVGKASHVHSLCNELVVPLEETVNPFRKINLVVRAFDDGIAFRYDFPKQKNWTSFVMYEENTTFNMPDNPQALALFLPSFTSSHEGFYTDIPYNEIQEKKLMDMPVLFRFPENIFMAITEAAVRDYAGMYLMKKDGVLTGKLSPRLDRPQICVEASIPHTSPWRVLMISDRIGALIESNLLTNLNEPCALEDVSWIKPVTTTFPWWNGTVIPDTTIIPGNNFETNKYYIDFCARNGIGSHSVVEYGQHEWYQNDGFNFMPGPHADVTKPLAGLDMKAICDYGKSKGVDIRVWVHWAALYPKLDEAFALFEQWGLTGMMVDFMDRDDQQMIQIQEEILQKAAKHHLHIQFHGSSKPSGLHRTYPNEFTREGTLNYECYKWSKDISANHDISMPFTRLLAGATDYHLGGFRAVPQADFKIQHRCPLVTSTRCHMLAMYVVLESYLGMVCDYPAAYEGQPGFEFLQQVPTVWDETKVPHAEVNQYITAARRHGEDWYVGTITNQTPRKLSVPLDFLDKGTYQLDLYTDAEDVDTDPNHLIKVTKVVTAKDKVEIVLAADGGAVMRLKKVKDSSR